MRMSDWSSDLCSSDLFFPRSIPPARVSGAEHVDQRRIRDESMSRREDLPFRGLRPPLDYAGPFVELHVHLETSLLELVYGHGTRLEHVVELLGGDPANKSEERLVGKECCSTVR